MDSAARKARGNDLGSLRHKAITFVTGNDGKATELTKIVKKSKRGFRHHDTARMLCPQLSLNDFDANPDL